MYDTELQQLEQNIKQARKIADLGESLERLYVNRDFKKVVSEGYFEQEAVRLVHLKADANMQSDEMQKSILSQIDAIGSLSSYFNTLRIRSTMASNAIANDENTREELLAESIQ
mgnify:CR=1 FL=1